MVNEVVAKSCARFEAVRFDAATAAAICSAVKPLSARASAVIASVKVVFVRAAYKSAPDIVLIEAIIVALVADNPFSCNICACSAAVNLVLARTAATSVVDIFAVAIRTVSILVAPCNPKILNCKNYYKV